MNNSNYKELFIKESKERLEDIFHLLLDLESGVIDSNILDNLFRGFHSIKGMAVSMGLEDISRLSHGLEGLLHIHRVGLISDKKGSISFSKEAIDLLIEGEEELESMIQSIEEGTYLCHQDYSALIERIEGFIQTGDRKDSPPPLSSSKRNAGKPLSEKLRLPSTIKVDASTLDEYINLIGELISSRSRLMELSIGFAHHQFKEELHTIEILLKELYQQILAVRLLPFDNIALGLTKLVRDLSKEKNKEVEFSIKGGNVKLDRAILERAIDPLIHILRNAVDHGIEGAEERKRLGKPQKGKIEVKVDREKEGIIIEISDDGRGIDSLKIKDKAVSMGLISRRKADRLSNEEILLLISLPGFTMAEKVTQVSGRGVGVDVVRSFVDEVGGSLKISSELCRGTKVILVLPLSISIIRTLLISLYPDIFLIPLLKVEKVIELDKHDIKRGDTSYYFSMGKRDISILSLRKILKMPPPLKKRKALNLVLVDVKGRSLGLIVDDIIGETEAYVKPLKTPLDKIKGISGYTIVDEGRPAFLLDLNNLIRDTLIVTPTGRVEV